MRSLLIHSFRWNMAGIMVIFHFQHCPCVVAVARLAQPSNSHWNLPWRESSQDAWPNHVRMLMASCWILWPSKHHKDATSTWRMSHDAGNSRAATRSSLPAKLTAARAWASKWLPDGHSWTPTSKILHDTASPTDNDNFSKAWKQSQGLNEAITREAKLSTDGHVDADPASAVTVTIPAWTPARCCGKCGASSIRMCVTAST